MWGGKDDGIDNSSSSCKDMLLSESIFCYSICSCAVAGVFPTITIAGTTTIDALTLSFIN